MDVIFSMANYEFVTSSDTSEFVKSESEYYYIILTDRMPTSVLHLKYSHLWDASEVLLFNLVRKKFIFFWL